MFDSSEVEVTVRVAMAHFVNTPKYHFMKCSASSAGGPSIGWLRYLPNACKMFTHNATSVGVVFAYGFGFGPN
jgi:hypothetical protein